MIRFLSLSGYLQSSLQLVPWYQFWGCIFRMPTTEEIREAAKCLVTISNYL
jgi:hypothetical protein